MALLKSAGLLTASLRIGQRSLSSKPPKIDADVEKGFEYMDMHKGKVFDDKLDLPDALGFAVGRSRLEKISALNGNDCFYEDKPFHLFLKTNSKKDPYVVPSHSEKRIFFCSCTIRPSGFPSYLMLYKGLTSRCQCGHFIKLGSYDDYLGFVRKRLKEAYDEYHSLPEGKRDFEELSTDSYNVLEDYPWVKPFVASGQLDMVLPPETYEQVVDSVGLGPTREVMLGHGHH